MTTADAITAVVKVPQQEALLVDRDDPAAVSFVGPGEVMTTVSGKVTRVAYSLDPKTRTLRTEITIPNRQHQLHPGQNGAVTLVLKSKNVVSVPTKSLNNFETVGAANRDNCYRVVDGRARRTRVTMGRQNGDRVEILDGLSEGDEVIVDSDRKLTDGEPVHIGSAQQESR